MIIPVDPSGVIESKMFAERVLILQPREMRPERLPTNEPRRARLISIRFAQALNKTGS